MRRPTNDATMIAEEPIKTVHVYVAIHSDGSEGIFGVRTASGWIACVFGTERVATKVRPLILEAAKAIPEVSLVYRRYQLDNAFEEKIT